MQKFTPAAWAWIQAAWLSPERPSVRMVYVGALQMAQMTGWQIPSLSTVRRRLYSIPWEEALQARWPEQAFAQGPKQPDESEVISDEKPTTTSI